MLRWLTAGESHGPALVAIVEGLPAGVRVTSGDLAEALRRRRLGHGRSLGGPVAIEIGNSEWPKWETVMSADPVDADVLAAQARNAPLSRPRPGHADLAGMQKYGFDDARP
ncbi:MAG TPA: chorismate synthase, partial [Streptosporangiaceae bacterium]|nr:chorismate synthase [Streptosporangiaceae bacterium]